MLYTLKGSKAYYFQFIFIYSLKSEYFSLIFKIFHLLYYSFHAKNLFILDLTHLRFFLLCFVYVQF